VFQTTEEASEHATPLGNVALEQASGSCLKLDLKKLRRWRVAVFLLEKKMK